MPKSKADKIKKLQNKRQKKSAKRKKSKNNYRSKDIEFSNYPIIDTIIPDNLFEKGIGNCIFSRRMDAITIAMSTFLIDTYCLGVKDAGSGYVDNAKYQEFLNKLPAPFHSIEPEDFVHLVYSSIDYARDLGFSPHKDYRKAEKLFADIDPEFSTMKFEFGRDNKPFYISGPYDSPLKIQQILAQLEQRCGKDGFHFIHSVDLNEDDSEEL